MLDFLKISTKSPKRNEVEIYPKFLIKKSEDLMIRGGDFYAIWDDEANIWRTDEQSAVHLIDRELKKYYFENKDKFDAIVKVSYMEDSDSGIIDKWHKYVQKQMRDHYEMLDENLIFDNTNMTKKDYASKKLNYSLAPGDITNWDTLLSTLYSEEERHKIEWAIGAIVTGASKNIQKFMVLYGSAGTGKSTVLNIIQKLFDGYYSVFDAKALGSSTSVFALEAFKTNPLVAIQHDGDLSKIEDNTRLNSLVSHELMTVNEKYKSTYANRFKAFLFMGTNKHVRITDAKSGLIRRLIDVRPSGNKLPVREYDKAIKGVEFELGAIAHHCKEVYLSNPGKYDDYTPSHMMTASNDFYNFILEYYLIFKKENGVTLKVAWDRYKTYCDEARVPYPMTRRAFQEELKNYFYNFAERHVAPDGTRVRSYFYNFKWTIFENEDEYNENISENTENIDENKEISFLNLDYISSIFDSECADCIAQYANDLERPITGWDNVTTKLSDLDTSKTHYVRVPENHIVIDFDIPDEDGNKCYERNIEEASKWPPTYAELSKSGNGVHLHYIYTGDVTNLNRVYADHIEIKVYTGKSSLRRRLTKCNDLPISTISSGLPLKGEKKMVSDVVIKSEKSLIRQIERQLNKETHGATRPSIDFIHKILEDAYDSGLKYDVSGMRNVILDFAKHSTNQSDYCVKRVSQMKFKSEEPSEPISDDKIPIVFYDVEVFPNLFLVNWKYAGENMPVVRMINPTPNEIDELRKFNLIGFNCRRYDNHILYARIMGFSNEQLYRLSQRIISGNRNAFFREAYNLSYTDVYDFSNTKQSLKKWEIELGIHHQELGLPWDQPVPEEMWGKVAEYCDNDVIATEAVFNHLKADWTARQILADLAGATVNDTTNTLTARIIFGNNRKPQDQFNYRDMGDESQIEHHLFDDEYATFDKEYRPIFKGYKYEYGKSTYRGEEVSEGGYVYAEPGIYGNVALLDIASMHPSSAIAEDAFGEEYTRRFKELKDARVYVKHKEFDKVRKVFDGRLAKYLTDEYDPADLAYALKIPINMVYGQTFTSYDNPFRDPRNKDNFIAKRGALFMVNLKYEVQKRGFIVAHIKTDSIKIPDATPEIIQFVNDYGKAYGYDFEHEATYERMCLVNDAVYIAKYKGGDWTATGTQFAVPYVFKTLFSKEDITFDDMCETKSVSTSLYLDLNEDLPDVSIFEKVAKIREAVENKGVDSLSKKELSLYTEYAHLSDEELADEISNGHFYQFVGRVGRFCPIKSGCGGAMLMREKDGKYYAATGSKGFRWLESEEVRLQGKEADIDRTYYDKLVNAAVDTISEYGDFEYFISDDICNPPPMVNGSPVYLDQPPWN